GWVTEWLIVHAWKACVPKGTGGSNPPPSVPLVMARQVADCITLLYNKIAIVCPHPPMFVPARGAEAGAALRVIDRLIFLWEHRLNTGGSNAFQPQRCCLISITVIEWIRDKTSRLIPDVQVRQTR